ncbi:uncharacterized protein LOC120339095 isoform X1 [Styela clava]
MMTKQPKFKSRSCVNNTEVTLKKFRRHSHSPGVRELLNDDAGRSEISRKKRRRKSDKDWKSLAIRSERSPMLDAAKFDRKAIDSSSEVQKCKPGHDECGKRDEKFQHILGAVFSDPESQNQDRHSQESVNSEVSELKLSSRKCGESSSRYSSFPTQHKDNMLYCQENLVDSSSSSDSEESNTANENSADDTNEEILNAFNFLADGLDPQQITSICTSVTTMTDRSNFLRNMFQLQHKSESDDDSASVSNEMIHSHQTTTPSCSIRGSDDMFVMGAAVTCFDRERGCTRNDVQQSPDITEVASPASRYQHSDERFRNFDSAIHLRRFSKQFADIMNENDDQHCDYQLGLFPNTAKARNVDRDTSEESHSTLEKFDFRQYNGEGNSRNVTDFNPHERKYRNSPNMFERHILPHDSRSPASDDFERLTNRALATVLGDDSKSPPNFFSRPFELI